MSHPTDFWCSRRLVVTLDGPQGRSVIPLAQPFARIGRSSGSDIVLENPWVARRSLYLHATDEGVFCFFFQPEETTERRLGFWLAPGEPLLVGPYRIYATLEGDDPEPEPAVVPPDEWGSARPPYPLFQVYSGGAMRDKRRFRARLNLIGRRHECALQVKGQQVSAFHGCLYWQYPQLWYIDLVSSNGTTLNGRAIDCAEVRIGDQLEIGEFTLLYQRLSKSGGSPRERLPTSQPAAPNAPDKLPADFEEDMPFDFDGQIPLQLDDQLEDAEVGGSSPVIPLEQADVPPATSEPAVESAALAPVQQTRQELALLQQRVEALTQLTTQVGKTAVQHLAQKTREAFEEERQRIGRELERRGRELAREKAALENQWKTASRELATQVSQLRDEASLLARQRQAMEQSRLLWDAQRADLERQLWTYAQQLQRLEQAASKGLAASAFALPAAIPANVSPMERGLLETSDPRTPLGLSGHRKSGVQEELAAAPFALAAVQRGGAMTPRSHIVDAQIDAARASESPLSGLPGFSAPLAGLAAPSANSPPTMDDVLEGSMASPSAPEPQAPQANGERPAIKGRKPSSKGKDVFGQVTDRMVEMELGRRKTMIVVGIAAGVVVFMLAATMVLMAILLR